MHLRLSRRIYSTIKPFIKKGIFAAIVIAGVLGNTQSASADILGDLNLKYENYINLFNPSSNEQGDVDSAKKSGLYCNLGSQDSSGKIAGIKCAFSLAFDTTKHNPEWYWDRITSSRGVNVDSLLVRVCQKGASENFCWLNTIPVFANPPAANSMYNQDIKDSIVAEKTELNIIGSDEYTPSQKRIINALSGTVGKIYSYSPESETLPAVLLSKGNTFEIDLWYCAGSASGEVDGVNAADEYIASGVSNPSVRTFKGRCGDTTYFRIGTPFTLTIPTDSTSVQSGITAGQQIDQSGSVTKETGGSLPSCGLVQGSIIGCIAQVIYYLIFKPLAWIAALLGNLFDFFIGYSVSDEAYRASFVVSSWRIVRDICNIFFIIIMVYTGLATVFGIGKVSWKSVVPALILNALLINFSLFFTRVIIDISNITARIFYSRIYVCSDAQCSAKDPATGLPGNIKRDGPGGYWPISEAIVSSFNPQKLFQPSTLSMSDGASTNTSLGNTDFNALNAQNTGRAPAKSSNEYAGYFIIVTLMSSAIIFGVAMMFWKVAFMFVGRVIGLYISMIFAPLAFISRSKSAPIPIVGNIPMLSWGSWTSDITKYALLAPIFTLFLYVIYSVLQSGFMDAVGKISGQGFFNSVIGLLIPMIITYFLIQQGVKIAEKYAGEAGKRVQGFAQTATGFVGGAALGGAALMGRNVVGRLGTRIAGSQSLKDMSARGGIQGKLANWGLRQGDGLSRSTFDLRNSKLGNTIQQQTGVTFARDNVLTRATGTGVNSTAGGFVGAIDREKKSLNERADRLKLNTTQALEQDAKHKKWQEVYNKARDDQEALLLSQGKSFDEVQFKKDYEKDQKDLGNARVQSSEEVNREREQVFQESLNRGTFLSNIAQRTTNRITAPAAGVGATVTAIGASAATGGALIGGAALVGQGAIQGEARQTVVREREERAKNKNDKDRAKNESKLNLHQQTLLRVSNTLSAITKDPLYTGKTDIKDITENDMLDYRTKLQANLSVVKTEIIAHDTKIKNSEDAIKQSEAYIRANEKDVSKKKQVDDERKKIIAERAAIGTERADLATKRKDKDVLDDKISDSKTALNEYNRVRQDIKDIRDKLA